MKKIDFLAIGDIAIDAFIKIKDAHIHCNIDKEGCELCVRFGDKIPYESITEISAVGNSPNAVIAASRLGLSAALVTNLGDDLYGKDCLVKLKTEKVDTSFIKIEKNKVTNYHYILWYDVDRTILVKHEKYKRSLPKELNSSKNIPAWIYLSSLGEDSSSFYDEIINYLKKHEEIKLAFQPGTFQIKMGIEKLHDIYKRTEAFFCNLEEAQRILKIETDDILTLSKEIKKLGPKMIFISNGTKGAYLYLNNELWHIGIYPFITPALESTGAGDAFSSAIICALILGKTPLEAFLWGPINARFVIQKIGSQAGLLTKKQIEEYLKKAPKSYKVERIF